MVRSEICGLLRDAWDRWAKDWHRFARRLTRENDEAEDLVSRATHEALRAGPNLKTELEVHRYILATIRHQFFQQRIRRRARLKLIEALSQYNTILASSAIEKAIDAEEVRRRIEDERLIYVHLVQLEPRQREAIELYFLREPGMTYREIATVQQVGVATAYERVQRALEALADALIKDRDG